MREKFNMEQAPCGGDKRFLVDGYNVFIEMRAVVLF
jgi:hypothetical protein